MTSKCLAIVFADRYQTKLHIMAFMIVFSASVFYPLLTYAQAQNTHHPEPGDKTLNSCGPQALRTVISLLGGSGDIAECVEVAGTDPNGMTTLAGLQHAAKTLGWSTKGMHLTAEELAFIGCPAILHVSLPKAKNHFIVFASSKAGSFDLIDATKSEQKSIYTAEQLALMWEGDCVVFMTNPFMVSLKAALYRTRAMLTVIVGIALGILAAVSISSCLSRYCRISFDSVTPSARKSAVIALASTAFVAATITVVGTLTVVNRQPKGKGPRLTLGATVLNVGEMDPGSGYSTSIWVRNDGIDTLRIDKEKIKGSCSCIRGTVSEFELSGGCKAELRVLLKSKRIGPFKHSVYIPSNDPQGGKVLVVKGEVTGRGGVVYPPCLYFGRVASVEGVQKSLFYILRRQDIGVLEITSDSPWVACEFNQRNPEAFEIKVSLTELPNPGVFDGRIRITTNDPYPQGREIVVPFSGVAPPRI
ncbi:MAG: cysteine peptidase family C39 domain-containing protein [Planctomycetota bacterium]|jgi:hypothetical protein